MNKSKRLKQFKKLLDKGNTREEIIISMGISTRTYYYYLKELQYTITKDKPKPLVSIKDLKALRQKVFKHKKQKEEYYNSNSVEMKDNKPIAILHLGDMHLDSDGVDLDLVDKHINLLRTTPGLYGGNLGDSTNNWVGFLGKLYGEQMTTVEQAEQLVTEYLGETNFMYTILGNHDNWNSGAGLIYKTVGTGIVGEDIRLGIKFPNNTMTTVHARHHFKGSSMYNPAQGSVKEAMLGSRDDIIIHGHIHSLGYSIVCNPQERRLQHCISVGSYKQIDSYKTLMGFRDNNLTPAVVTTIDPSLDEEHVDRVKVFFDVEQGINYLNYLRSK